MKPAAAELRADELNNRALSQLDLGRTADPEAAFEQARSVDPQHLKGHTRSVSTVHTTPDGRLVLSAGNDATVRVWEPVWELEPREMADWDEGARPHLETFLTPHTPFAGEIPAAGEPSDEEVRLALTRRGCPSWTQTDLEGLLRQLRHADYGWLRPQGVVAELERTAASWQGPPR